MYQELGKQDAHSLSVSTSNPFTHLQKSPRACCHIPSVLTAAAVPDFSGQGQRFPSSRPVMGIVHCVIWWDLYSDIIQVVLRDIRFLSLAPCTGIFNWLCCIPAL